MKKNIYRLIMSLAIVMATACQVIEVEPESTITAESFFKTAKDADAAILGGYDALQTQVTRLMAWGEGRADLYEQTERTENAALQLVNGNVDANNETYNSWNGTYTGINRVNNIIRSVPGIDDPALAPRKERILGEAYFLRGLMYFYLARAFDNVPLILEPYTSTAQNFFPTQAPAQEVFVQVEQDLREAEERIPDVPYGSVVENKGRATKAAVRAALVDFYLWQKQYQQAADLAAQIISSPANYTLVSGTSYASIFTNRNSSESIFEIQFNNGFLEGNNNALVDFYLPLGQATPVYPGGNWRVIPSQKLRNSFAANDLRRNATFQVTPTPASPWRDANRPYVNKYIGTVVGPTRFQDANVILYRLADVILMRAEALNELGETTSAIALLNQVRTRAGIGSTSAITQDEVRLAIENERFLELAYEGKRYFDLKRTGRYQVVTGHADPAYLRWPVASSELLKNSNLHP